SRLRGTSAPRTNCYHCGDICLSDSIQFEEKFFCCNGCKTVYEILEENQLCSYYQFNQAAGLSPGKSQYSGTFDYLDNPDIFHKLLHFSSDKQSHIRFLIPGIHCSSCIYLLENLGKISNGIVASTVDFPKREISIVFHPEEIKLSEIAELLAKIGYTPRIQLDSMDAGPQGPRDRSQWYKIGVAGFCFGNIMMLSFPEYFSIGKSAENQDLKQLFLWMNLGLSLPVLFYSAQDFFKSAWSSLKLGHLNIDLPISVAILLTFLRSCYELFTGTGPGYFDSMTGIVFFMLLGRVFQNQTYSRLSFDRDYRSFFPIAVNKIGTNGDTQIPIKDLQVGMRISIRNQELIPADAVLLRGAALIDYSFVSGESDVVAKKPGDQVYAGGRQIGTAIELEIIRDVKQSYLTQLWNNPAFSKDKSNDENGTLVHKINQYFSISVFVLAAGTAAFWLWQNDIGRMMNALTTILIVACPCILLLASTFTNGAILRVLGKNKFYLKNANVIERLAKADVIVFDKTGTITQSKNMLISTEGIPMNPDNFAAIYSLTSQSSHPLSIQIAAMYQGVIKLEVSNYKEIPGQGISGIVDGKLIRIGSESFMKIAKSAGHQSTQVFIEIEGEILGHYRLKHRVRPHLPELLGKLRNYFELYLLSGDRDSARIWLSEYFAPGNMRFECSPEAKLNFVQHLQSHGKRVVMVGDGLNDAGALMESFVGIAVAESNTYFSPACDAIIEGSNLTYLSTFISYCTAQRNIIRSAFLFSLIYNFIGLYFAVRGELQPVIAAILMPAASISIVLFVTLAASISAKRKGL
ncbi:MAG: heavy metal translocating P-type ATPase metal-binding domain-containing protein, partial [Saprospiraceae bacterium]